MTHEELFGAARWCAPSKPCESPILRAQISVTEQTAASITICGLGFFELYLNGEKVSGDLLVPAWTSYEHTVFGEKRKEHDNSVHRVYALRYPLSLRPGENGLRVWLGGGWYRKWNYGESVKCCYKITFPNGREVYSDETLEWSPSPIRKSEMLQGEAHDYRVAENWRPVRTVPPPQSDFLLQVCPADRVIRAIEPVPLGKGLYDCGENITGWPVLRLLGKRVKVSYAENLDGIESYGANWRQEDVFISDGEQRDVHPRFMWHAFRYFKVKGEAGVVRVEVVHSAVPITAHFESNNETLNWIFDAFKRTQLCNMHCGIPSDCPQYEGRGYTGDGQLAADAALLLCGGHEFYAKWMRDIADGQDPATGHICYTAPFIPSGGGPGGWGCAIVHVPWAYYQTYGDSAPLREYYPRMRKYFDYLELHSEDDLVTSEEPGNWCLGDWCAPDESALGKRPKAVALPPPFVNNYFYIKSLRETQQIAALLGHEEDIPAYEAVIQHKIGALTRTYYDPATGDFCGNLQGANAFAVDLGLGDERTLVNMAARYQVTGQYDTGIFGTDIVTRALFDHGYAGLAYDLLTGEGDAGFARWKRLGATTIWEYWNGHRSHSHPMFGAAARCLFRDLLGITQRPGTAGFTDLIIQPKAIPGLRCEGCITNAYGKIEVAVEGGRARVTLPENTRAEIYNETGETA